MPYEYDPPNKFGYKDTLPEGHDEKIIKGSEFDDEFKKISNAFKTFDPDFDGDIDIDIIDGLQDALDGKADQSALEKEIQDRKDGDQALQDQIDALDPDGDLTVSWDEIGGKPTEFPPEAHDQGWDTITGKPTEFPPEAHQQDWDTITGKPSEYPPEDHTHDQYALAKDLEDESKARVAGDAALASDIADLEAALGVAVGQLAFGGSYDASTGLVAKANLSSLTEGQPLPDASTVLGTFVIVAVAGDNPEELAESDWLVAGDSAWVAIKYGSAGSVLWDNVVGAPDFLTDAQGSIDGDSKQYVRKNGAWVESTGDSPWEVNGDDIYYNDGNVGIGTDEPEAPLSVAKNNTVGTSSNASAVFQASEGSGVDAKLVLGVRSGGRPYVHAVDGDTKAADSLDFGIGANPSAMRIDPDGNVGIGIGQPQTELNIKQANNDFSSGIRLAGPNLGSSWSMSGQDTILAFGYASSNSDLPTGKVFIKNTGEVGIGTDDPSHNLHIKGGATTAGGLATNNQFRITAGTSEKYGAFFSWGKKLNDDTYYALSIDSKTNGFGSDILLAPSGGNVGIGTDDPSHLLDLYGGGNTVINMKHYQDGSSRIYFESTSDGRWGAIHAGNNVTDESGNTKRISISAAEQNGDARFGGLEVGKESMVLGGAFAPNYDVHVTGKMGINTDDPAEHLTVKGTVLSTPITYGSNRDEAYMIAAAQNYEGDTGTNWGSYGYQHRIKSNSSGGSRITIDTYDGEIWSMGAGGRTTYVGPVGIGMTPEVHTAKEQLAEWKASFDSRLKAEPKADKKAVTLEITDDAFEVLPTEEALAEWMETRAAGDKLQVNGNISASGMVKAGNPSEFGRPNDAWSRSGYYGIGDLGGLYTGGAFGISLVANGYRNNNDEWTSLNANGKTGVAEIRLLPEGEIEFRQDADKADGDTDTNATRITRFFPNGDAEFKGTVTAQKFVGDGSGLTGAVKTSGNQFITGKKTFDTADGGIFFVGGSNGNQAGGMGLVTGIGGEADPYLTFMPLNQNGVIDIGKSYDEKIRDIYLTGSVYVNNTPLTRTVDLIETLSTLRNATKDETTLEGLRDAIGNAVGGLIEKFEAEIAAMPAPEVGTMEEDL
jgi:hypothetical protein